MARVRYRIHGIEAVQKTLQKKIKELDGVIVEGVTNGAKIIEKESKKLTSIDTGDLINSTFVLAGKTPTGKAKAVVGYKEEYAAAVHEMPSGTNWKRAGAENKFLQKAVTRNFTKIFNAIVRALK